MSETLGHLPECPITVHKGECCHDDALAAIDALKEK